MNECIYDCGKGFAAFIDSLWARGKPVWWLERAIIDALGYNGTLNGYTLRPPGSVASIWILVADPKP